MNEIKGFTFFRSYYDSLKNLKKSEQKEIIFAMLEYIFDDKIPNFSGVKQTIWTLIEPNLSISKKHSNKASGAPLGNQNARKYWNEEEKQKQSKINHKIIAKQRESSLGEGDKDKDKDKEREGEIFIDNFASMLTDSISSTPTPTLSQISDFCQQNDMSDFDCEYFYQHYEANGWTDGNGNKIKNWKAKVRKWYHDDLKNGKIKQKKSEIDPDRILEDESGRYYQQNYDGTRYYI